MATSQNTINFLLDQLSACAQVSARKMFGEYCLYLAGRPVGLVCNDQLYLKPTPPCHALMSHPLEGAPYPGARPHLLVPADQWDDRDALCRWVQTTADALSQAAASTEPRAKRAKKSVTPRATGTLADLPNLGSKSQAMLQAAGVRNVAQLTQLGSVQAYLQVKRSGLPASLNLLWALEGALTNLPWQEVARQHRTSLLLALECAQEQDGRTTLHSRLT